MSLDEARARIDRAKQQLEKVQVAALASDHENAVVWAFYAYENCVTSLAEFHNRDWTPNHYDKARLARTFHTSGLISRDIHDHLQELNRLRKEVAYDGPGYELLELDLEDLSRQLEEFIGEIEARIESST